MLQTIADILINIGDFFVSIGDFIVSFFSDLGYIVEFLGTSVSTITKYLSWLPGSFLTAIVAALSVVVVLRIVGR